jgi:thiol:disulfide interchange protein DsbD
VITQGRFTADIRDVPDTAPPTTEPRRIPAPLPEDAPEFFVTAFEQARRSRRPMVLVFGAQWCPACQRLAKETLSHPDVVEALSRVEMVEVDLDKWTDFGGWYGVSAVPHVVLIDGNGMIADTVRDFEPAETFVGRLRALVDA